MVDQDHYHYPLLAGLGGVGGVHEDAGLPVGDQAPVLHGAGAEVWDGDHVVPAPALLSSPSLLLL